MRHDKAGTLLELARHLAASAEGLTLDEMASRIGAARRTAERMRDAIEQLFPQIETLQEGAIKRYRIPGGLDGFFQAPTTEELVELSTASVALRKSGHNSRAATLDSLDRKVRSALKSNTLRKLTPDVEALARAEMSAVRVGPRPADNPEALATIRHAIMAMLAVSFRYEGGSSPGRRRIVCPHGILFERMNYLVAAELNVDTGPRNWRLDRIVDVQLTDIAASPPADFNLGTYAARSFGIYHDGIEDVALRVLPHGAEDARNWRFHPEQTLETQDDGSLLIRFRSGGMLELAWHLFTWGDRIEIVGPERLKRTMAEALRTAVRQHASGDTTVSVVAAV